VSFAETFAQLHFHYYPSSTCLPPTSFLLSVQRFCRQLISTVEREATWDCLSLPLFKACFVSAVCAWQHVNFIQRPQRSQRKGKSRIIWRLSCGFAPCGRMLLFRGYTYLYFEKSRSGVVQPSMQWPFSGYGLVCVNVRKCLFRMAVSLSYIEVTARYKSLFSSWQITAWCARQSSLPSLTKATSDQNMCTWIHLHKQTKPKYRNSSSVY